MERNALDFVFVASEAARLWGRHGQTVRYACNCEKHPQYKGFTKTECKISNGAWLVTAAGMTRLFGTPKMIGDPALANIKGTAKQQWEALQQTFVLQEAAELWDVQPRWRVANARGGFRRKKLFEDSETKKSGNKILVTEDAMNRVFGPRPNIKKEG